MPKKPKANEDQVMILARYHAEESCQCKAVLISSITFEDNGQGFDLNMVRKGLGLSTMRERAELSGGSFALESAVRKGTLIRVSWPISLMIDDWRLKSAKRLTIDN